MKTLDELIAEDEAKQLAATKAAIALEDARYHALPQSEKEKINSEREARFPNIEDSTDDN